MKQIYSPRRHIARSHRYTARARRYTTRTRPSDTRVLFFVGLLVCLLTCLAILPACNKFLDKKPDASLAIPQTVADFRALLDNDWMTVNSTPGLGPLAVDDYTLDSADWAADDAVSKGIYTWETSVYQQGAVSGSWGNPYRAINLCNVVLAGMAKMKNVDDPAGFNAVYGSALFYRAALYFGLEETYGQVYSKNTAGVAVGVPLRLSDDALVNVGPASVDSVYRRMINDAMYALALLPSGVQPMHNRPGRPAALALLARISLAQQDYNAAQRWSDSCLRLYSTLLDYNTVQPLSSRQFPDSTNPEILFQCSAQDYFLPHEEAQRIDTVLYNSYAVNDLRRDLYFAPRSSGTGVYFKGSYTGGYYLFSGLAVDEVWLISAESHAQLGDLSGALSRLNALLLRRWRTGTFKAYTALTAADVLRLILAERRKETLFRELRWSDLRRLNQNALFADTLRRRLGNRSYVLLPGDGRYTFPHPAAAP